MEKREFLSLVSAFEHAFDAMSEKVGALSPDELHFVPPIPEAWSVNEHLVHILDADCNMVLRIRGAVAEPGRQAAVWDEDAWRAHNHYGESDGIYCLDLAISLRKFLADSLRALGDAAREGAFVMHPERGRLSLVDVLSIYTRHAEFHMKYVERNLQAYAAQHESGA